MSESRGQCGRFGERSAGELLVDRHSRGRSSRFLVWLGGVAAFLMGGLVTVAHELPADEVHPARSAASLHEAHAQAGVDFGLGREIADYLNSRSSVPESSAPLL